LIKLTFIWKNQKINCVIFEKKTKCMYKIYKYWTFSFNDFRNLFLRSWTSGCIHYLIGFMVFNATFYNISVIMWLSVLLVEETGVPVENHQPVASDWQTLSPEWDSNSQLVVIGTDCTGSCKSNYYVITIIKAPLGFT
jgi:hypothetical protein